MFLSKTAAGMLKIAMLARAMSSGGRNASDIYTPKKVKCSLKTQEVSPLIHYLPLQEQLRIKEQVIQAQAEQIEELKNLSFMRQPELERLQPYFPQYMGLGRIFYLSKVYSQAILKLDWSYQLDSLYITDVWGGYTKFAEFLKDRLTLLKGQAGAKVINLTVLDSPEVCHEERAERPDIDLIEFDDYASSLKPANVWVINNLEERVLNIHRSDLLNKIVQVMRADDKLYILDVCNRLQQHRIENLWQIDDYDPSERCVICQPIPVGDWQKLDLDSQDLSIWYQKIQGLKIAKLHYLYADAYAVEYHKN